MAILESILSERVIYALGWTVVHSLWQAVAAALFLALVNLGLQRYPARVRYFAGQAALAAVLVLAVLTFIDLYGKAEAAGTAQELVIMLNVAPVALPAPDAIPSSGLSVLFGRFEAYFNQHMPLIVAVWMLGAALFALRLLGGLAYVQRLRYKSVFPVAADWRARLQALAGRLNIRRPVQLLESALVQVPMVIGHFKPIILLPLGAINALPPEELESILAHELAHIARRDYLVNLIQSIVESLFYFNPAIWWISAYIRTEREHCCDDLAVAACGDSLTYARALVSVQERSIGAPALAMAMARSRNQLLNRVRRILQQTPERRYFAERILVTGLLLVILLAASLAAGSGEIRRAALDESVKGLDATASSPEILLDTLPQEPTRLEVVKGDGKQMKVQLEGGKIVELEIDGKPVPTEEYEQYEKQVEEYLALSDKITPPIPPAPPAPPAPSAAPLAPAVPAPPAPPMPAEIYRWRGDRMAPKISRERGADGKTRITIELEDGEEIKILPEEHGALFNPGPNVIIGDGGLSLKDLKGLTWVYPDGEPLKLAEELVKEYRQHGIMPSDSLIREYFRNGFPDSSYFFRLRPHWDAGQWREWRDQFKNGMQGFKALPFEGGLGNWFEFNPDDHLSSFQVEGGFGVMNNRIRLALEEALRADGLLAPGVASYRLELKSGEMLFNGKRQSEEMARKYWKLYEKVSGVTLDKGTRLRLERSEEQ